MFKFDVLLRHRKGNAFSDMWTVVCLFLSWVGINH